MTDAVSLFSHTENYLLDGTVYSVRANFRTNMLSVRWQNGFVTIPLDEYNNFCGDMEAFIRSRFVRKETTDA